MEGEDQSPGLPLKYDFYDITIAYQRIKSLISKRENQKKWLYLSKRVLKIYKEETSFRIRRAAIVLRHNTRLKRGTLLRWRKMILHEQLQDTTEIQDTNLDITEQEIETILSPKPEETPRIPVKIEPVFKFDELINKVVGDSIISAVDLRLEVQEDGIEAPIVDDTTFSVAPLFDKGIRDFAQKSVSSVTFECINTEQDEQEEAEPSMFDTTSIDLMTYRVEGYPDLTKKITRGMENALKDALAPKMHNFEAVNEGKPEKSLKAREWTPLERFLGAQIEGEMKALVTRALLASITPITPLVRQSSTRKHERKKPSTHKRRV